MHPSVAVIGTVFVDYKGFAPKGYNPVGRNVGRVEIVPGGVARNVAVNMRHLSVDTWFVGTISKDGAGEVLKSKMNDYGIHLDYLATVPEGGTGAWLVILGEDGSLKGSVSQMPDVGVMRDAIVPVLPKITGQVDGIALEIDLSEDIARAVLNQAKSDNCKLYALPGNFSVIGKNYDMFEDIECFICNEVEAGILFGEEIKESGKMLSEAIYFAKQHKLRNFVVTMGENGAVYIDHAGASGFQDIYPTEVIDSTGAGDAFFSATTAALLHKKSLAQAVDVGAKIASLVISAKESDCSEFAAQISKNLDLDWFK